ncbi:MAG: transglutaminase-like domain-containing protein [Tannerella sp.]|jgi:transglutaminase-like putative cysteine protease|nr:transglutaminase-like domain-containing protein [Tannerella sp.]
MKRQIILLATVLLAGASCADRHFINDADYRAQVEQDFEAKKAILPHGDLFSVFDRPGLTLEEEEALRFMYAYMPIADIVNRDGEYYLSQVQSSLRTRDEMEWGSRIPEEVFRHFVLPVRVNNEDLDTARVVFAAELKERIKGLSMRDAVLEINHWCHEHVVYTPTDMRTIAPLAIIRTAWGRCGEESTFTVTALRSVGIPARQIYTPRWAHTDSNHAWVEAWVDGKWYFFGACEPEPVLNLGWFNGPAYRAMLLHTRVFGKYGGPEEVMMRTANFTEINVLPDYAPTATGAVTVVDGSGSPVKDATVEFMIYNSTSFASVLTEQTGADGRCRLTAGKGDMFIWVSKDGMVGCSKLSFGKDEDIRIVLDKTPEKLSGFDLDIVPPVAGAVPTAEEVTDAMRAENDRRLALEDSIRGNWLATFITPDAAAEETRRLGIDGTRAATFLTAARGNWRQILQFLTETSPALREQAVALLGVISIKDLQDTPADVLRAHLLETENSESPLYVNYILNPRIGSELLTPYKQELRNMFTPEFAETARANPQTVVDWCKRELTIVDELNPQRILASPVGVAQARVCDAGSRDVFFIALCRSLGIPARTDPVTRRIQCWSDIWVDADFGDATETNPPQGSVMATFDHPTALLPDPVYRQHFTISRIGDDGRLQGRNYRGRWSALLRKPLAMDAGTYMLLTGARMANGSVLAHVEFFTVDTTRTATTQIVMRESADEVQVIGSMDPEALYRPADGGDPKSFLATAGRGYFIIGILGARQEPTNHAMNDIARTAAGFEAWGRSIILLFPDERGLAQFDAGEFGSLPSTVTCGIDTDGTAARLARELHLPNATTLPIFIIADSFGRIVYVSQGYTIGIGDEMLKVIHRL